MGDISTTDLLNILNKIDDPEQVQDFIDTYTGAPTIAEHFETCMKRHNVTKTSIIKECTGFYDRSYYYEIFNGKKQHPARDIIILICLACHMTLKETRRTLKLFELSDLYPRFARDAIIAMNINRENFDIETINDQLAQAGEKTLGKL